MNIKKMIIVVLLIFGNFFLHGWISASSIPDYIGMPITLISTFVMVYFIIIYLNKEG